MALSIYYSSADKELIRQFIQRGDVPCYLYKYRTVNSVEHLLMNHSIYFSCYKDFNDPFESAFNTLEEYTPQQYYDSFLFGEMPPKIAEDLTKQIACGIIDGKTIIKQLIKEVISSMGYYCMTSKPDNLLMWAHYADSHKGVCLKFDILKDLESFLVPVPIDYNPQYINFDVLADNILNVVRRKSPDWKYEDEYRIIKTDFQGPWKIKPECLVEIIFGCRTPGKDKDSIKRLASSNGFENIKFSEAREKNDSYGLEIREII